ncbi:MAG: RelA/SpoT domain-containing protein [Alphaproteobacteria bacterium]|nr:RelA/SpoT domain-containing protein [Alphaproteobacteria bacterium]
MEWAKPKYSKGKVDRAGKALVEALHDTDQYVDALEIINNWRASHNYPLNTFKVTLRRYASKVDNNFLVAQRIKRLSSIEHKLERFTTLRLSQMQDIGGCRAILSGIDEVYALVKKYEESDLKHTRDDIDDYITKPKESGYRGIHLIYKYNSDKTDIYNGLYIEIQIRSRLQHAWATAVETVGTFLTQPLKSSLGEEKWLRFFAVMGSVIALREGSTALVPGTPTTKTALIKELRAITGELDVIGTLKMFGEALNVGEQSTAKGNHFFLLKLEPTEQRMTVTGFSRKQLDEASKRYLEVEKEIADTPGADAVLVSVDSLTALKRAYPNYFLDTQVFLDELRAALKR